MNAQPSAPAPLILGAVTLRPIQPGDLPQIAGFAYTVSITDPLADLSRLQAVHADTALWTSTSGALAIADSGTGRLLGTVQFYAAGPAIHGIELGYLIHDPADRGRGLASPAVRRFSDLLFEHTQAARQQLLIEVWNTPSWKLAERCGFVREGILRSAGLGEDPADCFVYSRTRRDWREERLTHVGG